MAQTVYTDLPALGQEGQLFDSTDHEAISKYADGTIPVGRLVVASDTDNNCVLPAAVADDPDAIMLTLATLGNAVGDTYAGADFDGAFGAGQISPARNVTITQDTDADWDATTAVVYGEDEHGNLQSEDFALTDAGNDVIVGTKLFSKVISVTFPAQSGDASGSVGLGTLMGFVEALGVSMLDQHRDVDTFSLGDAVPVFRKGRIIVTCEGGCTAGDQAYARMVITGEETLGSFRASPDGTAAAPDAAPVSHAKFVTSAGDGELAVLELDLVGV